MGIAKRRADRARLAKQRKNYWGAYQGRILSHTQICVAIDTPKPCSCYICGNPRRRFGHKTIQELKSSDRFADQLDEIRLG